ncbi:ankyrin repeat domain-containing protein [Paraconexibacter antarcticus]|uniref:Ankyrin repeat domain-containing protein n=1 Tax=Paraconexibacter antarcticus TaxID=2949664 RepID=A0ABY5DSX1_9ACTN|nr:ankyrin repeat domain-containing protein [Paraconexibacter antarcticus]UTI63917.1 ankyrin repeat domain-containing protein [Paraconexibacter antarcticus]
MTWCLPAQADFAALDEVVAQQETADLDEARRLVGARFGFASWDALRDQVDRRLMLNARDLEGARARIAVDAEWATRDMTGWCDHCLGAAPLNYMAMLRFDAPRLGLSGPLEGTGEMAKLLLDAGAPVNGNPGESETPLMTAASYGDADVAKVLIAAGADVDALASPDAGGVRSGSALLHAAVFGMTDVLDAVVSAGAKVRSLVEAAAAGDLTGWPIAAADAEERLRALIMAADHQRFAVIDALLEAGAPIDGIDPAWGRQALCVAAEHGRPASVRHLLERGADPAATDGEGRTPVDLCQGELRYLPGPHHDEVLALLTAALEAP